MKKVIYAKLKKKENGSLQFSLPNEQNKKGNRKKTKSSRNSSNYCTVSAIWPLNDDKPVSRPVHSIMEIIPAYSFTCSLGLCIRWKRCFKVLVFGVKTRRRMATANKTCVSGKN